MLGAALVAPSEDDIPQGDGRPLVEWEASPLAGCRCLEIAAFSVECFRVFSLGGQCLEDGISVGVWSVEYEECYHLLDTGYKGRIRGSVNQLLKAGYRLICSQGSGNYTFVRQSSM